MATAAAERQTERNYPGGGTWATRERVNALVTGGGEEEVQAAEARRGWIVAELVAGTGGGGSGGGGLLRYNQDCTHLGAPRGGFLSRLARVSALP